MTGAILAGPLGARPQRHSTELRVQTDLVSILASVTDQNGQPVPDLTQDSFQVSEEGVPQKIARFEAQTDRPLDLALMIDSSMSAFKDLRFEADAAVPDLVRRVPHVAFEVTDLSSELAGREVLIPPNSPSDGVRVAFIVENGAPIELLEFTDPNHPARLAN